MLLALLLAYCDQTGILKHWGSAGAVYYRKKVSRG